MNHIWWRTHLRRLSELGIFTNVGNFDEVDQFMPFLTQALDLPTGGKVLDLGCGRGSVAIRLAQWGYQVTAIDEAAPMLEVARQQAEAKEVDVEFRHASMTSLPDRSAFDGALLLDFGAHSDADNAAMIRAVAAAVKPGGKVLFGACNPYYWSRRPVTQHQVLTGIDIIQGYSFDFLNGTVVSRVRCILKDGSRKTLPVARFRAYTLPELRYLTSSTGLADLAVFGEDDEGRPRSEALLDTLGTPYFHCLATRPVIGESGEGI
jgi:2-polyprenyl-3-methyl-5-hydroxy-6-metoxy-1,4-benzoquinol methylase